MKLLRLIADLTMVKTLGALLLVTGLYYSMYYDDGALLETQINDLKGQLSAEEIKKKDTEATIKKEDEMRANLAALARDLQVVKAKLPNELRDIEMTSLVNKAATEAGLTVTALAKETNPSASPNASIQGSESVEEVVFDITMKGAFNQLVQFLEVLKNEEKILKIRDFKIDRATSNLEDSTITFVGKIVGFKQAAGTK